MRTHKGLLGSHNEAAHFYLIATGMSLNENTSGVWRSFVSGPSGAKEVLIVALPMVISSLSWTVMTFVDRMMLRWVSGDSMSAAFQANIVWFSFLCLPLGICSYANSFVSQYFGDGQNQEIGTSVWQAIWFAVFCIPLVALGIPLAPSIFAWANHGPSIEPMEIIYFDTLCIGSGGMLVSQAASAFFSGRGKTSVVMIVDCLFAVVNLVLDYIMIFGYLGCPELGIAGAGYPTAIALWLKACTYVVMMLSRQNRIEFGTGSIGIDWDLFRRLIRFGGPSGVQMFLDVAGFSVFCLLLGRLGSVETEATSMAFSISSFAFMPIWGLSIAAGILVGQRLGENREDLAERSTWISLILALTYMATISMLYCLVPNIFLSGFFAAEGTGASSNESRELAAILLRFVAAYNLFDASLMVLASAIKGAGDTRFVMLVSLVMTTLLCVSTYLAVVKLGMGLDICWVLITAWVCILGIIFFFRFRGGKWKKMRVIDMVHVPPS